MLALKVMLLRVECAKSDAYSGIVFKACSRDTDK